MAPLQFLHCDMVLIFLFGCVREPLLFNPTTTRNEIKDLEAHKKKAVDKEDE
jgi:hypothetical protein